MDKSHPLNLNLHRVANCLSGVLLPEEINKITAELHRNVSQVLRLSQAHLRFANLARERGRGSWRQVVSRGYYCCYCASRALRLAKSGAFSADVDDHKRIGDLPTGFPELDIWADTLTKFRADRNLADYDHTARSTALEYSTKEYLAHATKFLREVKKYLRNEGVP